jgi:hypothetical protein
MADRKRKAEDAAVVSPDDQTDPQDGSSSRTARLAVSVRELTPQERRPFDQALATLLSELVRQELRGREEKT